MTLPYQTSYTDLQHSSPIHTSCPLLKTNFPGLSPGISGDLGWSQEWWIADSTDSWLICLVAILKGEARSSVNEKIRCFGGEHHPRQDQYLGQPSLDNVIYFSNTFILCYAMAKKKQLITSVNKLRKILFASICRIKHDIVYIVFPQDGDTPKSSILIGFSIITHPAFGYLHFRKPQYVYIYIYGVSIRI